MTSLMGPQRFVPGDRFFEMAEYITVYMDMEIYAISVVNGLPISAPAQQFATLICNLFPIEIRHNVFGPFWATFQPIQITSYEFTFVPKRARDSITYYASNKWGDVSQMFFNTSLVYFYEKHVRWINRTYGSGAKDRDSWPDIFRFAWALRNAATHHNGTLHITDPKVPPVVWHHLKYDHLDAGLRVLGGTMNFADILVFMIELSAELDRLGCPHF